MRANLRPLTYWVIHEKYKVRFSKRTKELVQGIITTEAGEEITFDYEPENMIVRLLDKTLQINHGGWIEHESSVVQDESNA